MLSTGAASDVWLYLSTPSHNYDDVCGRGSRGEVEARGGGDVGAHRRRRATKRSPATPVRPAGGGGATPSALSLFLDDASTSPSSSLRASGAAALATNNIVIVGRGTEIFSLETGFFEKRADEINVGGFIAGDDFVA